MSYGIKLLMPRLHVTNTNGLVYLHCRGGSLLLYLVQCNDYMDGTSRNECINRSTIVSSAHSVPIFKLQNGPYQAILIPTPSTESTDGTNVEPVAYLQGYLGDISPPRTFFFIHFTFLIFLLNAWAASP
jgi:hypothetical protein